MRATILLVPSKCLYGEKRAPTRGYRSAAKQLKQGVAAGANVMPVDAEQAECFACKYASMTTR